MRRRWAPSKVSRGVLLAATIALALSSALVFPSAAVGASGDVREDATAILDNILAAFPDRKTSSPESGHFLSYASALLQKCGWSTSVFQYETTLRCDSPKDRTTTFLRVSGEDLLAFGSEPAPAQIDLLIIAPYDNLLKDDRNPLESRPHTAQASSVLLRLASTLGEQVAPEAGIAAGEQDPKGEIALALVSGHYQLGAGTHALLEHLGERGINVGGALFLADMFSPSPLVIAPNLSASANSALWIRKVCKELGLIADTAFPLQPTWVKTSLNGAPGALNPSALLGFSQFEGEGTILEGRGIPAITLGFAAGDNLGAGTDTPPYQMDTQRAAAVNALLRRLSGDAKSRLFGAGSKSGDVSRAGESAAFAFLGRTVAVTKDRVRQIAAASTGLAVLLLVLFRRLLSEEKPVLLGGTSLAAVVSFALTWGLLSDSRLKYLAWINPVTPALAILILFTTLIALGFLQMWNVKSRIANLPGRNATESSPDGAKTTMGGWGLAVMTAVTAGTGLSASPFFPFALASTSGLAAAVIVEGVVTSRKQELGSLVWLLRCLYLLPAWAAVFWAGRPDRPQYLTHMAATLTRPGTETLATLLSLISASTCLISTFSLPRALSPKSRLLFPAIQLLLVVSAGWALTTMPWMKNTTRSVALVQEQIHGNVRVYVSAPAGLSGITYQTTGTDTLGASLHMFDKAGGLSINFPAPTEDVGVDTSVSLDAPPSTDEAVQETAKEGENRESVTGVTARAEMRQRPTYLALTVTDVLPARSVSPRKPIELTGLEGLLGRKPEPDEVPTPRPGYRVNYIWWYPKDTTIEARFGIVERGSSRAEVVLGAVYLDRSVTGIEFSSERHDFLRLTSVLNGRAID